MLFDIMNAAVRRKFWFVVKISFGMLYILLGGEIFLRIFAPEPILPRYVCATSYGIRGNDPNRSYQHTTTEYRIRIRTNSRGVRADEEIPYEKPDGVKRIILLGDSFGMGYGVNLEDTFSNQMKNYLEKSGIRCELVNLSVSGHGTAEQLIALKEQGLRYQPDLVLLAWHYSDFDDNIRSNLYRLEGNQLVRKSKTYLPGVKIREFLFKFSIYRLLAGYSHLYSCVREKAAELVKYKMLPVIRSLTNVNDQTQELSADAVERAAAYRENLTIALLKEIKRECISHGAKFLILGIPARLSRTEFKSTFPEDKEKTQGLDIFSPIEHFKKHNGEKLYWERSHGHFTPLGCKIVGEGLAEFVLKSKMLDGNI